MKVKSISYYSLAQRLGRILSHTSHVKVVFAGAQAFTDSHTIVIPTLPPGTMLTPSQAKVFTGYIDHEASHVRHTDFNLMRKTVKAKSDDVQSFYHWLWNLIEDVWIENASINEYPGSLDNLDAMRTAFCREQLATWVKDESENGYEHTYADRVLALMHKYVFKQFRDFDELTAYDPDELGNHADLSAIQTVLDDVGAINSTATALALADRLLAVVPPAVLAQFKVPSKDEPSSLPQGEPVPGLPSGSGSGTGVPSPVKSDSADQQSSTSGSAGEPAESSESKSESGAGAPSASPSKAKLSKKAVLKEILKALDDAAKHGLGAQSFEQFMQAVCDKLAQGNMQQAVAPREQPKDGKWFPSAILRPEWDILDPDYSKYHIYRDSINAEILAMKRRLHIQLRAMKAEDWTRGLEDGELDPSALHLIRTGNWHRLYRKPLNMDAVNTAVGIMADGSGSMDCKMLAQSVIALAEAIAGVDNIKLHVGMFHGSGPAQLAPGVESLLESKGRDGGKGLGLCDAVKLVCMKNFDESWAKCAPRFGSIKTFGSTPMSAGYDAELEVLAMRYGVERRILLLVTDGDTNGEGLDPEYSDYAAMAVAHQQAIKLGIETYGFELGKGAQDSLAGLVDRAFYLAQGAVSLPEAVLKLFSTRITYKRQAA